MRSSEARVDRQPASPRGHVDRRRLAREGAHEQVGVALDHLAQGGDLVGGKVGLVGHPGGAVLQGVDGVLARDLLVVDPADLRGRVVVAAVRGVLRVVDRSGDVVAGEGLAVGHDDALDLRVGPLERVLEAAAGVEDGVREDADQQQAEHGGAGDEAPGRLGLDLHGLAALPGARAGGVVAGHLGAVLVPVRGGARPVPGRPSVSLSGTSGSPGPFQRAESRQRPGDRPRTSRNGGDAAGSLAG